MKRSLHATAAFSLVEITLALGVAAFCLIAILGILPAGLKTQQAGVEQTKANAVLSAIAADLRAAVRLPPGQQSKQFSLHPHNGGAWDPTPDWIYFDNNGNQTGTTGQSTIPANAVLTATIIYYAPPSPGYTTSLADIKVTWPAQAAVPTGSVETFISINR